MVGQTEKGLAKQNKLRYGVWFDPNNGVLIKVGSNSFGRLEGQTQSEVTLFCRSFGAFFAAGAFNGLESQHMKLAGKFGVSLGVGRIGLDVPLWVIGSKESAAVDAIFRIQFS